MSARRKISIVTACYNEEENVELLYEKIKDVINKIPGGYDYEHLFIDNSSSDDTVKILKRIAEKDKNVKIIVNSRNFGHVRSPVYGLFQATGDVVISIVADFQDPPELIPEFIKNWEDGYDIVLGVKDKSQENRLVFAARKVYYSMLRSLSEVNVYKNFTGFGLYDRKVMDALKQMYDPYPFFRGMIGEVGYRVKRIKYEQPRRKFGISKNKFYSLYDMGITGIINNSKVPLRIAVMLGLFFAVLSFFVGVLYFVAKLIWWKEFTLGIAPIMIFMSFMFAIILLFIGILGEYIGAIYTQVLNRPLVFEKERINF